jgi:FkbM family methyltransferase
MANGTPMKKNLSLWIYVVLLLFSSNGFADTEPQTKSEIDLIYTKDQEYYERIIGENRHRDAMIQFIHQVSMENYTIYHTPLQGKFYLEEKHDCIKNILRSGEPWEPQIQKLFSAYIRPNSTVLDIGAHIGTHTLAMSKLVGPNGRVIAFEPQPKIFRELFLNMQLNEADNVFFYPAAVGDHKGTIELAPFVWDNEGGTSLLGGGTGQFVPLITIDSLHLSNVSLMKIDVEMMENPVLDGAKRTIARCRPIIIIEIQGNYSFESAPPEIKHEILTTISKLEGMKYQVTCIGRADYLAIPSNTVKILYNKWKNRLLEYYSTAKK